MSDSLLDRDGERARPAVVTKPFNQLGLALSLLDRKLLDKTRTAVFIHPNNKDPSRL